MKASTHGLFNQEKVSNGADAVVVLDPDILDTTGAGVAKTIELFPVVKNGKGKIISLVKWEARKQARDKSDATFDDLTVEAGDTDNGTDHYLTAQQVGTSGGTTTKGAGDGAEEAHADDSTHKVTVTLTPEAGKSLKDIDEAEIRLFFAVS